MKKKTTIKFVPVPQNSCGGNGCHFKRTLPFGVVKTQTVFKKAA